MKTKKLALFLLSGLCLTAGGCASLPAAYTSNADIPVNLRGKAVSTCTMPSIYGVSGKYIVSAPDRMSEIEYLYVEMTIDLNEVGQLVGIPETELASFVNSAQIEEMLSSQIDEMAETFCVEKEDIEISFENNRTTMSVTMDNPAVIQAYNNSTHVPFNSLVFSEVISQLENQQTEDQQMIFCE